MAFSPASLSEDGDGSSRRASACDPDKICLVCGDKAIGYNFGIVACESCKSFFRRQASRADELRCPFKSCCEINLASRRFCQSCRLKKCFAMGMSPELLKKTDRDGVSKKRTRIVEKDVEDMLIDDNSDDEVSVPKEVLAELIRKTKRGEKLTECICKCKCGFYSPGTRLIASSSTQPPLIVSQRRTPKTPRTIRNSRTATMKSPSSETSCSQSLAMVESQKKSFPPLPIHNQTNGAPSNFDWYLQNSRMSAGIDLSWYNSQLQNGLNPIPNLPQQSQLSASLAQSLQFSNNIPQMFTDLAPINTTNEPQTSISCASAPHNFPSSSSLLTSNMIPQMSDSQIIDVTGTGSSKTDLSNYQKLSPADRNVLEELLRANEPLNQPLDLGFVQQGDLSLMDVVSITNLALRRIISMAKELKAFKNLQNQDKMNLMKGGCSELLILRGVMVYDPSKNSWNYQGQDFTGFKEMQVKLEILLQTPEVKHFEEHKRFLSSFTEQLRKNDHVMLILNAIVLFSPHRQHLEDPENIGKVQKMYIELLLKVLQCHFAPSEAYRMHDMLMKRLVELNQINLGFVNIYYGLDPTKLDPLILELLDIQGPFAQKSQQ